MLKMKWDGKKSYWVENLLHLVLSFHYFYFKSFASQFTANALEMAFSNVAEHTQKVSGPVSRRPERRSKWTGWTRTVGWRWSPSSACSRSTSAGVGFVKTNNCDEFDGRGVYN
jgi:hypothetical protein